MQVLYGFFQSEKSDEKFAYEQLLTSIERIYELYILLLNIIGKVLQAAKDDSSQMGKRIIQDKSMRFAHQKFIDNKVINLLSKNDAIRHFAENYEERLIIERQAWFYVCSYFLPCFPFCFLHYFQGLYVGLCWLQQTLSYSYPHRIKWWHLHSVRINSSTIFVRKKIQT